MGTCPFYCLMWAGKISCEFGDNKKYSWLKVRVQKQFI